MKKKEGKSGLPARSERKGMGKKGVKRKTGKGAVRYEDCGENVSEEMQLHEPQTPYIRMVKAPGEEEPWRPPFGYESFDLPGYNLCRLILDQGHTHAYIWILRRAKTMDDVLYTAVIPMMVMDGTVTPDYITSETFYRLLAPFVGRDVPGFHNRSTRENRFGKFRTLWELFTKHKPEEPLTGHFKELVDAFNRLADMINEKLGIDKTRAVNHNDRTEAVCRNTQTDVDGTRFLDNNTLPISNDVPPPATNSVPPASDLTQPTESDGYVVGIFNFYFAPLGRSITVELNLYPNPLFPDEWVSVSRVVDMEI